MLFIHAQFHRFALIALWALLLGASGPMLVHLWRKFRRDRLLLCSICSLAGAMLCTFAFAYFVAWFDLQYPGVQFPVEIRLPATYLTTSLALIGLVLLLVHEQMLKIPRT